MFAAELAKLGRGAEVSRRHQVVLAARSASPLARIVQITALRAVTALPSQSMSAAIASGGRMFRDDWL